MTRFAVRCCLVLCGLAAGFAVLEVGMRTAGWAIRNSEVRRSRKALRSLGPLRIVCAGESTTAGDGLSGSYPEMLEAMLDRQITEAAVSVVNFGSSGAMSGAVVDALAQSIDEISPAVVIAMMGINDAGNTHSYGSMIAGGDGRWYGTWRLYKLYRVLLYAAVGAWPCLQSFDSLAPLVRAEGIAPLPDDSVAAASLEWRARNRLSVPRLPELRPTVTALADRVTRGGDAAAEDELRTVVNADPGYADTYVWLAEAQRRAGRRVEAHATLLQGMESATGVSPGLGAALAESHFERGEHERAFAVQRSVLDELIDPANLGGRIHHMLKLAELYERAGRLKEAEAVLRELVERVHPGDAMLHEVVVRFYERTEWSEKAAAERELLRRIRYEYVNPRTRENYKSLRRMLAARGVPLVAVQYPGRDVETLRRMLDGDQRVAYVDNSFFRDLVAADGYERYFRDRFAGDFGHLTPEGNCLLARNVARAVVEEVFGLRFDDSLADCGESVG